MTPFEQISRRRTCAIIFHPNAGKTTLTEKLLVLGGRLDCARSAHAHRNQRTTPASDWLDFERPQGDSISSVVHQFEYEGHVINLLDTAGHDDFSEDTFRVLTAADAVVMVIDAAKGVESRTRRLFEVCRQRGMPVFAFINKCDLPGRDPLVLISEIEQVLGIALYPVNWPLGMGRDFRGVYDRVARRAHFYERTPQGQFRAPDPVAITDTLVAEKLGEAGVSIVAEDLSTLDGTGAPFDDEAILAGRLVPVFFGTALNNFGVQLLLDGVLALAPPPGPHRARHGVVPPDAPFFSGYIFKARTNSDLLGRNHLAFLRVCSGHLQRDMTVTHVRSGRTLQLSRSHLFLGKECATGDEAWPGDVVGIAGHSDLRVGDTLSTDPTVVYTAVPRFPPECFAYLHNEDPQNVDRFHAGLDQLLQEKVVQRFNFWSTARVVPLLGAIGASQFQVMRQRLEAEYGVPSRIEPARWTRIRWLAPEIPGARLETAQFNGGVQIATDDVGRTVLLFIDDWSLFYFEEKNPGIRLVQDVPSAGEADTRDDSGFSPAEAASTATRPLTPTLL